MGFKFRYESLLNYRRHLKEVAQIELARSVEQLAIAKEALNSLTENYQETARTLKQDLRNGISAQRLQNYTTYLERLKADISHKALEVAEWEQLVEKRRISLLEKDKELKVIDKLKDKDLQKWLAQEEAKEQKGLSEMAVLRHGRVFR